MYSVFTYIWVIYGVNVGKYSIHGAYGIAHVYGSIECQIQMNSAFGISGEFWRCPRYDGYKVVPPSCKLVYKTPLTIDISTMSPSY